MTPTITNQKAVVAAGEITLTWGLSTEATVTAVRAYIKPHTGTAWVHVDLPAAARSHVFTGLGAGAYDLELRPILGGAAVTLAATVPAPAPPPVEEAPSRPVISGTTYYVSPTGSDAADGKAPSTAWQTLHRVNQAQLLPGDGVLLKAGSVFAGNIEPSRSGSEGSPIIYGTYEGLVATISELWIAHASFLVIDHLGVTILGGRGSDVTVQNGDLGNTPAAAINVVLGDRWKVLYNYIHDTGDSGILTQSGDAGGSPGTGWLIEGNKIERTGLSTSITYGKHGIYMKCRSSKVLKNTIIGFSANGVSQRYSNCDVEDNVIREGGEGIAYFEYDTTPGTSNWKRNTITATKNGMYSPASNTAPPGKVNLTVENFVIEDNTIGPLTGGSQDHINIKTQGTVAESGNVLL